MTTYRINSRAKFIILTLPATLFLGLWLGLFAVHAMAASPVTSPVTSPVCKPYPSPDLRFGFNLDLANSDIITNYATSQLNAHWYLDYTYHQTTTVPTGMSYAQMIRAHTWKSGNYTQSVVSAVKANPGALWILGNEPDRYGQDGLTPQEFATFYHDLYRLLRQSDASAKIAVGAVVQGTPLRLRYLSMVLDAYRTQYANELPTDSWTVHGFILRECNSAGCWGASIPPGLDAFADEGKIYAQTDHGSLAIFKQQLIDFRRWMANHGYRETPLILTEYGILFPPQLPGYAYKDVSTFMKGSFDFLVNTTDSQLGYPADDNRLVQAWSWFSLNVPEYNIQTKQGFNGNLFDPKTKQITALGVDYANYVGKVRKNDVDLGLASLGVEPSTQLITEPLTVTATLDLRNFGGVGTNEVVVDVSIQPTDGTTKTLIHQLALDSLGAGCGQVVAVELNLQPFVTTAQAYSLSFDIRSADQNLESNLVNNQPTHWFLVLDKPFSSFTYLPVVER